MRRSRVILVVCSWLLFLGTSLLLPAADAGAQARGQGGLPAPSPFDLLGRGRGAAEPETGTAGLSGRIVAADSGTPLRRAQVTLVASEGRLRRGTTTDGNGDYAFSGLPAGRYTVSATKAGYVTLQYGQRRAFESGRAVTIAGSRQVTGVNLPLPRGAVIVVRVTDDRGDALPGAMVQVQRYQYGPDGQPRLTSASAAAWLASTDDRGDFRAYGLMPGEYVISARASLGPITPRSAPGTASGQGEGLATTFYPGSISAEGAQPVSVGLGEETFVQLPLVAARFARVSGTVTDSAGRPAVGASISLATYSDNSMSSSSAGTVAADGTFSLAGVPPGDHYLQVRYGSRLSLIRATGADGSSVVSIQGVAQPAASAPTSDESATVPISVAGRDITGLGIVTSRGTEVAGTVVYEGDPPPRSATGPRVSLTPVGPFAPGGGSAPVDEEGSFRITGASGRVLVDVTGLDGWSLLSVTLGGRDVTDEAIDLDRVASPLSGMVATIASDLPRLRGTVSTPAGETARDYAVVLQPAEALDANAAARRVHVLRPDAEGTFESPGLRPGRYVATAIEGLDDGRQYSPAFREQLRPRGREVQVGRRGDVTLDLVLVPGL